MTAKSPFGGKIAIYVSSHGYGHTTRSWEVAKNLVETYPDAQVIFTGWALPEVVAKDAHSRIQYRRVKLDAGIRQLDSLNMDLPGTLRDLADLEAHAEAIIAREVDFLQAEKIQIALVDIPPLAFEAAARAGVPALAMGNFSWDWIYQAHVKEYPALTLHIKRIRRAYRSAKLLFRLPFFGRMDAFRQIVDAPLVARKSKMGRKETRRRLEIDPDDPVALFSFGGFGLRLELEEAARQEMLIISTDPSPDQGPPFLHLPDRKLLQLGLRYPDLVAASDAVVSKPGYGIVSECIANRAALLYLPRGPFREYPILVREMKRYLRAETIALEDLTSGKWVKTLHRVMERPEPGRMDCGGAEMVAKKVMEITLKI